MTEREELTALAKRKLGPYAQVSSDLTVAGADGPFALKAENAAGLRHGLECMQDYPARESGVALGPVRDTDDFEARILRDGTLQTRSPGDPWLGWQASGTARHALRLIASQRGACSADEEVDRLRGELRTANERIRRIQAALEEP